MICPRNWDSPWRGNGRPHLNCRLVKGHAITFSGIAKSVNMCKSPSSFLTHSLGGSGSQREGILPEELFMNAPVTLLIYILFKEEKRVGVCTGCCRVLAGPARRFPRVLCLLAFCTILKMDYLPPTLWLSLNSPPLANTLLPWKKGKWSQVTVSNAGCSVHGSLKVFKISVL